MSGLTRREVLTAALGSSVALAACKRLAPPPAFEGRLLGQSLGRGHVLRDGGPLPTPRRTVAVNTLIVGGGPAGLSAAWKLRRSGFEDFTLLELEDHLGGTSASGQNAVSAFPWGAHYVPAPLAENRGLIELLREMDAFEGSDEAGVPRVREELLCRAPQERLFLAGSWQEGLFPRAGATPREFQQLAAFEAEVARWVAFRDTRGRRAFSIPSVHAADGEALDALDRQSMAEWMDRRGLDSPRLRWFVEYGCRDDYGGTLATTSAYAGLFYFCSRVDTPGQRGAEFVTWPEGNGRLVRHLSESLTGKLQTGRVCLRVTPEAKGATALVWDTRRNEAETYVAQHIILALPHFVSRRLLEKRGQAGFSPTYSSWVVANLTLEGRPREPSFPLAWDNVLYDSRSLGYVVATHQSGRDEGPMVWTYYLPLLEDVPAVERKHLLASDWRTWVDIIFADLERAHPDLRPLVQSVDVWKWGHAMVRPTPGLMRGAELRQARAPIGRVHFAHTDLSGIALFEESQYWGLAAAESVLSAQGRHFRSSL